MTQSTSKNNGLVRMHEKREENIAKIGSAQWQPRFFSEGAPGNRAAIGNGIVQLRLRCEADDLRVVQGEVHCTSDRNSNADEWNKIYQGLSRNQKGIGLDKQVGRET